MWDVDGFSLKLLVETIDTVACTIPPFELVWNPVPMAYCRPVRSTDEDARCTLYMNNNALPVDDCRPQATVLLLQRPADITQFGIILAGIWKT